MLTSKQMTKRSKDTFSNPLLNRNRTRSNRAIKVSLARANRAGLNLALGKLLDVYACSDGDCGKLGLASTAGVTRPYLNQNIDAKMVGVIQIAPGGMHVAALITHDSRILIKGVNDNCVLECDITRGSAAPNILIPIIRSNINRLQFRATSSGVALFVRLAAADNTTLALTADGLVHGLGTYVECDTIRSTVFRVHESQDRYLD